MNVVTVTPYDPRAPRDLSPLKVGKHTVNRRPVPGSPHVLYCLMDGSRVIGKQLTPPSAEECDRMARAAHTERASGEEKAAPPQPRAKGELTDSIIALLASRKLGLGKISEELKANPDSVSQILAKLTRQKRVLRRGPSGKYVYEAAHPASTPA